MDIFSKKKRSAPPIHNAGGEAIALSAQVLENGTTSKDNALVLEDREPDSPVKAKPESQGGLKNYLVSRMHYKLCRY